VIADPLDAVTILLAGEDVEAHLGPTVYTLGELKGFVLLMLGRVNPIERLLLALESEVGVQLDHQAFRSDRVGTVDLDFIIALGSHRHGQADKRQKPKQCRQDTPAMQRGRHSIRHS